MKWLWWLGLVFRVAGCGIALIGFYALTQGFTGAMVIALFLGLALNEWGKLCGCPARSVPLPSPGILLMRARGRLRRSGRMGEPSSISAADREAVEPVASRRKPAPVRPASDEGFPF